MLNPFNLEQNDAKFVAAVIDVNERNLSLIRLIFARSLMFIMSWFELALMLLLLLLGGKDVLAGKDTISLSFVMLFVQNMMNIALFLHLDLQIKFLKATEALNNQKQAAQLGVATDQLQSSTPLSASIGV